MRRRRREDDNAAKRAAIYCRVSTAAQGTDRQLVDLLQLADRAGYEVVGCFTEVVSGAKTSAKDRRERTRVLDLAQRREIDLVLVTEISRWGRSTQDLVATLDLLQAQGVSLITQQGLQFDLATAQGKMVAQLMSVLAEFERGLLRERVKSGLQAARSRGRVLGRQKGFAPTQQRHGARILQLQAQGASIRKIARHLGISPSTVQRFYKGQETA